MNKYIFTICFVVTLFFSFTRLNAQWKQLPVGQPGQVEAVMIYESYVFAGTSAGIYRSTNNGENWTNVSSAFTECFAIKGMKIFAGTYKGILKSTDGGITWNNPDPSFTAEVQTLAVRDTEIYAGGAGIFRSKDGGNSWTVIENGLQQFQYTIFGIAANNKRLFAATLAGLVVSTDDGNNWSTTGSVVIPSLSTMNCVAAQDSIVLVGSSGGLFRSNDYGSDTSWTQVNVSSNTVLSLTTDSNYAYAGTVSGARLSTDYGKTWSVINDGLPGNQIWSIAANNLKLIAGTMNSGVFFSSNNGTNWISASNGIVGSTANFIAGNNSNVFVVINNSTLDASTDNGISWSIDSTLHSKTIQSVSVDGSNVFAITIDGIYQSSDNGNNWGAINGDVMDTASPTFMVTSGSNLIVGTQHKGIFLSSNMGENWHTVNAPYWDSETDTSTRIASLASAGSNVFAGTHRGLFSSSDYGEDWVKLNDTLININTIAISGSTIFAGRYFWPAPVNEPLSPPGGIFRSTDNGKTWSTFSSGLPIDPGAGAQVYAIAIHNTDIFAALDSDSMMYSSKINGTSWTNIAKGLPDLPGFCSFVNDSDIFVGAEFGGIWRRPLSQVTAIKEHIGTSVPASFHLAQNYPNPFNPTTVIEYSLPMRSKVMLYVFDILGRKVATLVNRNQTAGTHSVTFNASNLASGVYLYRLSAGNFIDTKKLMLIK
jgi:photosystem II stability/assembly factor-like uncharacterized protein